MKLIQCWIEHPIRKLDQTFAYLSDVQAEQGARIEVPFGHGRAVGFVESCMDTEETPEQLKARLGFSVKKIIRVLDESSLITPELHDLALWMKEQTLSTAISCFQAMLPGKVKPVSSKQKILFEKFVRLSQETADLTPKELEAYLYVKQAGEISYHDLRQKYPGQAHALVEKNAVDIFEKEKAAQDHPVSSRSFPFVLSDQQKHAMEEIEGSEDPVYLLHGATGSGKTEIYLQLAEKALQKGKQVLILVPEIALTPQMIERVAARFGTALAIYHSGLNAQQKYEQYRRVMNGKAEVVVGTRSAVFLPFHDLGLIVMDEEHDPSYKQENQPSYHCRDVAIWRGKFHHCKVILGSATPSLDTYARALKHVYHLVVMKDRINQSLPKVTIVSMKDSIRHGDSYILSEQLKQKIHERLVRKEQVILLLNRRGYNTQLRCRKCGEVITCPHCDLAMSYHREEGRMKCHACGYEMIRPRVCPKCGSSEGFLTLGFGTERLEQEVHACFEGVRTLRMDADTTSRKDSHEKILAAFGRHEADILLGTQMIAKGLDYPNVTLVGVINGDDGLKRTDFRSCETSFDLLMQAGGRSGRGEQNGEVVYQVFDPDHYAVQCAAHQDYVSFFQNEMLFRRAGQYPPYTYLIALTVVASDQQYADHLALKIKNEISGNFKVIGVISLLKIQDRVRSRVLLKGKNLEEMRNAVQYFIDHTDADLKGLRIDVNPLTLD
jgi:primosomal protein N' (replication factor Y)